MGASQEKLHAVMEMDGSGVERVASMPMDHDTALEMAGICLDAAREKGQERIYYAVPVVPYPGGSEAV
ncbi:MAG: hypothetical protein H0U02_02880 [Rubrobacter sp.]|jgi:hypothetical protein|nr:hypothetical protein [Rubrobacter sp.]